MSGSRDLSKRAFDEIVAALRGTGDRNLGSFSKDAVRQAIEARMKITGCESVDDYLARLKLDGESARLFETVSVGITRFFRDPDVFDAIACSIVPEIVGYASENKNSIRVWVPGCASGEEAYTFAMLFLAVGGRDRLSLELHATDVDETGLDAARRGIYPKSIEDDIPKDYLQRYLKRHGDGYQVGSQVRAVCRFSNHDLNDPAPVAQADLVSCRNVLSYHEPSARQRMLARVYESLRPGGVLVVGPVEDVDGVDELFEPIEKRHGLYRAIPSVRRVEATRSADTDEFPFDVDVPRAQTQNPDISIEELLEIRNTELERLNRELGYRVDQLETTLSLVPVGIAICEDPDCEDVRVNREGGELLGVEENTNIGLSAAHEGLPFSIRSHDDSRAHAELPIREVLESGEQVVDRPLYVVRSDGSQIDILVSAVPLLDENGRARGAIMAFVDNTGHSEERRRLTALHEVDQIVSRLGIDILSENDIDVILEMVLSTLLHDLHVELAAVFEYGASHGNLTLLAGKGWEKAESLPVTLSPGFEIDGESTILVEDLAEEKRISVPVWMIEEGIVSLLVKAVRSPGEPFGALGVFSRSPRQFSEIEVGFFETVANLVAAALDRDYMQRMLADARDRLNLADARQAAEHAEQLAALGTLAAGISHEINNPLNSILVNAELGLLKLDSDQGADQVRNVLETIVEDVRRCARITESVLNLARSSDAPRNETDINDVVLQARELVASHLQIHDACVELELGDLPALSLDSNAMESAMVNLLRNAAEAGRNGVVVSVKTRLEGDVVTVVVDDDGPGIAPEHLDHIFDPFYSTKLSDKGTGLGLSLVHRTVTDHGGSIRVDSREGLGTTFTIKLPIPGARENSCDQAPTS